MTPEQQQQLAAIHERHAKMPAGDYTKREQHDDWGLVRRPDGWPFADVCVSVDYSHEEIGKTAPDFVDAKREFVSHAVADIDFLLALLADAERERDEIARDADILLGIEWQRSVQAVNGDPEAAREHRIAALVAELATANERAEQAADARQAEIVAWLRMQADRGDKHIDEHGLDRHTHPSTVQAISTMRTTADAIERGEFRGKS